MMGFPFLFPAFRGGGGGDRGIFGDGEGRFCGLLGVRIVEGVVFRVGGDV